MKNFDLERVLKTGFPIQTMILGQGTPFSPTHPPQLKEDFPFLVSKKKSLRDGKDIPKR